MTRDDPGLLEAVARVGSSLFGMLQNRLELASIEIGEARERLVFTIVASFAAVLGWIALVYGAAGVGLSMWPRAKLRSDPPLLADTLAELRTDAAMMRGESNS